jgi:hypothetical protein
MMQNMKACLAVLAGLGLSACGGMGGQEPLYALVDGLGRPVAVAGASQLGNVAPGTAVRANIGGVERDLMVAERVGMGPVVAQPAPAPPVLTASPLPPAVAATQAEPAPTPAGTRAGRRAATRAGAGQAVAAETGANRPRRNRLPPARSVSRSVM